MKSLQLFLCLLCATSTFAVEIKAKNGRSIDVTILSADSVSVKVRLASSGKQSTIRRDTLSLESNNLVDDFVKQSREEAVEKNKDLCTFDVKAGGKPSRVTLWLPNKKVALAPQGAQITISGGNGANHISLYFQSNPKAETAEKEVNNSKQQHLRMAAQTSQELVDKLNKIMTVAPKKHGNWEGYFLEGWTDRQAKEDPMSTVLTHANNGYFSNGTFGVSIRGYFAEGGDFQKRDIEKIVGSMTITDIP
jgi:hypothetical protein